MDTKKSTRNFKYLAQIISKITSLLKSKRGKTKIRIRHSKQIVDISCFDCWNKGLIILTRPCCPTSPCGSKIWPYRGRHKCSAFVSHSKSLVKKRAKFESSKDFTGGHCLIVPIFDIRIEYWHNAQKFCTFNENLAVLHTSSTNWLEKSDHFSMFSTCPRARWSNNIVSTGWEAV